MSAIERNSLIDKPGTTLALSAQKLRLTDAEDDIGRGSELAEIVLYGVMKHHYGALPVVPKIFHKQNINDNAKGADSVHIVLNNQQDDFTLWFGEAKFFTSIEDARLPSVVESVANSLKTDKLEKENSIITNLADLAELVKSDELRIKILKALSHKSSIDELKSKIHVPILLLHQCEITGNSVELNGQYKAQIKEFHELRANSYFKKHVKKLANIFKYEEITFHLIIFPVPNKKDVIDGFLKKAQAYKD